MSRPGGPYLPPHHLPPQNHGTPYLPDARWQNGTPAQGHDTARPARPLRQWIAIGLGAAVVLAVGLGGGLVLGTADSDIESSPPAAPVPSTDRADRSVCVDLDARGGALYSVFIVPAMAQSTGQISIDIPVEQFVRATAAASRVGAGALEQANPEIRDEGQRMVAAAEAAEAYDHAEGTALLTSFVGLSIACQKAGHKPSWFDAEALAR